MIDPERADRFSWVDGQVVFVPEEQPDGRVVIVVRAAPREHDREDEGER
jgi:hypothetical protein